MFYHALLLFAILICVHSTEVTFFQYVAFILLSGTSEAFRLILLGKQKCHLCLNAFFFLCIEKTFCQLQTTKFLET